MIWQIALIDNRYKMGVSETFLAIGKHIRDLLGVKATVVNNEPFISDISGFPRFLFSFPMKISVHVSSLYLVAKYMFYVMYVNYDVIKFKTLSDVDDYLILERQQSN